MRKFKRKNSFKGFTLVEVLMVLSLIGILTVVSLTAMDTVFNDAAFDKTYQKMNLIKVALVGDLDTNKQGIREYFGYLGDVGSLPSDLQGLQALISKPAGVSSYAINSTSKTGMGWRGPYLKATVGVNWLKDGWGNDIVYSGSGTPYLLSYGSDGVAGGSGTATDIQINLTSAITTGTIYGVINKNSVIYAEDATVELYEPDGYGALTSPARSVTLTASDSGRFSFSNVTFGLRSLKVTLPGDTIGPVILPIDREKYMIPHNFLDATPGSMPHVCSDFTAVTYDTGTLRASDTNNRIYFDISVTSSMTINTLYIQPPKALEFKAIRIGNDTKSCGSGITCCQRSGNTANCVGQSSNSTKEFPEVALTSNWTIAAGDHIGVYLEFSSSASDATPLLLRLGCDMVYAQ